MDALEKFKIDSIVAQLKRDLPNLTEDKRATYVNLLEVILDDHEIEALEVNGGKENFICFIDKYADKLLQWKYN